MNKFILSTWSAMTLNTLLGITDFLFLHSATDNSYYIVGAAFIPFMLLTQLLAGIGIETNCTVSKNGAINLLKLTSWVLIVSSVIACIGWLLSDLLLFFVHHDLELTKRVFNIILLSLPPMTLLMLMTGYVRGYGKPEIGLIFTGVIVLLNIILDYLLIHSSFSPTKVEAVTWATVVSDGIGAAIYFAFIINWKRHSTECMSLKKFFSNAFKQGYEKLISSGLISLFIPVIVIQISSEFSILYFGLDRFIMPFMILGYAIFEWKIHSHDKVASAQASMRSFYCIIASIYFLYILILMNYLNVFSPSFRFYLISAWVCTLLFWYERILVANFFSENKGGMIIKYITFFKILMVVFLLGFLSMHFLNPVSFSLIFVFGLFLQNIFLYRRLCLHKRQDLAFCD